MSLELTAKFHLLGQRATGEGRNGTWVKQELVVETLDQYPRKICFICWGDLADKVRDFKSGDMLKIQFSLESREYNGKWYTDAKPFRIEKAGESAASIQPPSPSVGSSFQVDIDPAADDLPF